MSSDPKQPSKPNKVSSVPTSDHRKDTPESDLWELDDDISPSSSEQPAETPPAASTPPEKKPEEIIPETPEIPEATQNTMESESSDDSPIEISFSPKGIISRLSLAEKISLLAVLVIIITAAVVATIHLSNKIPVVPLISSKIELPIEGKRLTITSLETYWRKPVTTGSSRDVVRPDTALIPCIKMQIKGSSSAIRILFRNEDNTLVGDNISRNINSDTTIELAATDGFKEIGAHAAYRASETEKWTIEILEGPSADAPFQQFEKILEVDISTDLR